MRSKGKALLLLKWALQLIGLCGTLAFAISVISPADDDVPQDCVASSGRTLGHKTRLLRFTHPGSTAAQIAVKALHAACLLQPTPANPARVAIGLIQLPDAILPRQTGERSPPRALQ